MDKDQTKPELVRDNLSRVPGIWNSLLKDRPVIKYSHYRNVYTAVVNVRKQDVTYQLQYFSELYQLSIEIPINLAKSTYVNIDIYCFIANYVNCSDIQCQLFMKDGQIFLKYSLILDYSTQIDDITIQLLQLKMELSEIATIVQKEGDSQIKKLLDSAIYGFRQYLHP